MIKSKDIKEAAKEHVRQVNGNNACYDSFIAGAEWASQFPSQGLREALEKIANNTPEWNPNEQKYDCQIIATEALKK